MDDYNHKDSQVEGMILSIFKRGFIMFFDKKISIFQGEFESREQALESIADLLVEKQLVGTCFKKNILEREVTFPTGLPTVPYGVAIPHTDADYVTTQQIGFASLKKPIEFQMMGNSNEKVEVSLIFMLAIKNADEHLGMLQKLIEIIQSEESVKDLMSCTSQRELDKVLLPLGLA